MGENSVSPGQLGNISYGQKSKTWTSTRSLENSCVFKYLGNVVEYVPLLVDEVFDAHDDNEGAVARHRASRRLAGAFSHMEPAVPLLIEHLKVVHSLRSEDCHDITIGDLMAAGKARGYDPTSGGRRDLVHDILAIAGGENGNGIRLLEMRAARQGWDNDRSFWINTFDMKLQEAAWWDAEGAEVRQVCFAPRSGRDTTLLAVRFATSITILRPLYVTTPLFRTGSRFDTRNRWISRIDPNPLLSLRIGSDVKNSEFVDVAFNPWYQQQLGAVDSLGRCILWTIAGKSLVGRDTLRGEMKGQAFNEDQKEGSLDLRNSWHKITWIRNENTFIICNRKRIEAFEIRGHSITNSNQDVFTAQPDEQVLDMRNGPNMDGDLFVATTTRLCWFRSQSQSSIREKGSNSSSFQCILQWTHDRDVSDLSLQLSLHDGSNGIIVLLRSRENALMHVYTLVESISTKSVSISISDPVIEPIRHDDTSVRMVAKRAEGPNSIHIVPCSYGERPLEVQDSTLGRQYREEDYRFLQILTLDQDFSLTGRLCYLRQSLASGVAQNESLQSVVTMPNWKRVWKRYKMRRKDLVYDDMIVNDEEASDSGLDTAQIQSDALFREHSYAVSALLDIADAARHASRSVPNEIVYNKVMSTRETEDSSSGLNADKLFETVLSFAQDQACLLTLYEIVSRALPRVQTSDDFPETSVTMLAVRFEAVSKGSMQRLAPLGSPEILGLSDLLPGETSIPSITRALRHSFMLPLNARITNEARSSMRAMVKDAAATIFFASIGAHKTETGSAPQHDLSQASDRSEAPPPTSSIGTRQYLPSPSATPSVGPDADNFQIPDAASARLRRYASIANPPTSSDQAMSKILDHWSVGKDPAEYDWEHKTAELSGERFIAGSAMSAADREKQERRQAKQQQREEERERRRKRLRLDAARNEGQPAIPMQDVSMSSQPRAEARFFESQGSGAATGMSNQDLQGPGAVEYGVASQIEPGRFGGRQSLGRLPVRTKGQRKAGF